MITTRREVNIDNGNTELRSHTVKRIAPEERVVSINPEVEVKPFADTAVSSGAVERANARETYRVTADMTLDELMPTIKSDNRLEEKEESETRKLSSKTKVMLCVYMATALILALIVLATGLAIGSASKEVASLESEVKFQSEQLAETDVKLSYLGDELTITGAATELGMVKTDGATEIELIDYVDGASYEARTGAFDKFCDFVSKVFGG